MRIWAIPARRQCTHTAKSSLHTGVATIMRRVSFSPNIQGATIVFQTKVIAPRGASSEAGAIAKVAMSMKASLSTSTRPNSHLGFLKYGVWSPVSSSSRCTCFWIARPTVTHSDAKIDMAMPSIHSLDSGFSSSPSLRWEEGEDGPPRF